jgi:hypothetical protein
MIKNAKFKFNKNLFFIHVSGFFPMNTSVLLHTLEGMLSYSTFSLNKEASAAHRAN